LQGGSQARRISAERAKAILENKGFHPHGHTGIVEAVEVVVAVGRKKKSFCISSGSAASEQQSSKLLTLKPR
jgi:hypothetical protein